MSENTNTMRQVGPGQEMLTALHDWAYQALRDGRVGRLVIENENSLILVMKNGINVRVTFDEALHSVARALVIMQQRGTISSATFIECSTRLKKAGVPNALLMTDADAETSKKAFTYDEFRRMSKTPEQVLAGVRAEMDDMRNRMKFLKAAEAKLTRQIEMERQAAIAQQRREAQEQLAHVEQMLVEAKAKLKALDA